MKRFLAAAFILPLLFSLGPASPAAADTVTYAVSRQSITDPDTRITQVKIAEDHAVITLNYTNRGRGPTRAKLYPPGHKMAYYLIETKTSKKYPLTGSSGLPTHPDSATVKPGQSLTFELFFGKIPLANFNLMEGSLRSANETPWHFHDVEIGEPIKIEKGPQAPPQEKKTLASPKEEQKKIGKNPDSK
ncbi:MAG: hypothetical protein LBS31_04645 [Candidatus Adiutrix sp.]|jgi:hypothetical protein|nr:hypothetical protein [Candidatus Adiutrix sp.]